MNDSSDSQDYSARFYGGMPIRPLVWAALAFVLTFIIGAVVLPMGPGAPNSQIYLRLFVAAIVLIPGSVLFWPRPRFMRQIAISSERIIATDRRGRSITILAQDVQMISAEATMVWEEFGTNPWGRLYLRARGAWIGMKINRAEAQGCYRAVVRRFPHVLGIPGIGDIDLPEIVDAAAFDEWVHSIRRLCRTELRRQIAYNLLNAGLLLVFGAVFGYGAIVGLLNRNWKAMHDTWVSALFVVGGFGGAFNFVRAAIRRQRLYMRVVAELHRAESQGR